MNEIRSFQATDRNSVVKFHGIFLDPLLADRELDDVCDRGMGKRAPYVPGGTPYSIDDN